MKHIFDLKKFKILKLVMRGPRVRGGAGGRDTPHEKSQNYRVFSNTGPDPLKNYKAIKPAFHVGPSTARQRNATLAGR